MKKIFFYSLSSPHLSKIENDFFIGESADEILEYSLMKIDNTELTLKILGTRDLDQFPELFQVDPGIQKAFTKRQFKNNMLLVRDRYIKSPIDKKHFSRIISTI